MAIHFLPDDTPEEVQPTVYELEKLRQKMSLMVENLDDVIYRIRRRKPQRRFIAEIVSEVSEQTGISIELMRSKDRHKDVFLARAEAMARAREELPDYSLPMIGRFFDRDHSTVIKAIKRVRG